MHLDLDQLCTVFVDRQKSSNVCQCCFVKFLFLPSNLSDGKKTDLSLRVAISMSMGVPGGVGDGGGVGAGVVVGVAPKLGGKSEQGWVWGY